MRTEAGRQGTSEKESKKHGLRTYTVHAQVVPDAVLPALGFAVRSLVGVSPKPVVDITQHHGMASRVEQGAVD